MQRLLSQQRLAAARLRVFEAVQQTINETNQALGFELLPWRKRTWAKVRRRPWYPVAPMPREFTHEQPR
jgi:hypothetical protein